MGFFAKFGATIVSLIVATFGSLGFLHQMQTTPSVSTTTVVVENTAPNFSAGATISSSTPASATIVSTEASTTISWQTFPSEYGYSIQYPNDWSYTSCVNGMQVSFLPWRDAQSTCEGIDGFGPFTITGPLSQSEIQYAINDPSQKFIKTFQLNGMQTKQYSFDEDPYTAEPDPSTLFISDIVLDKNNQTFQLIYPANDATDSAIISQMLSSFSFQ